MIASPLLARGLDRSRFVEFAQRDYGSVHGEIANPIFAINPRTIGQAPDELARRIGLAWRGGTSRFRRGELNLEFGPLQHPITAGFGTTRFVDESYWNLVGDPQKAQVLATQVEAKKAHPMPWTIQPAGGGRVFGLLLGHYSWTFDDPLFRILVLRGLDWTVDQPIDRFNDLVTPGARLSGGP